MRYANTTLGAMRFNGSTVRMKFMQSVYKIQSAGKILLPKWKLTLAGFSLPVSEFALAQSRM